MLLDFKVSNYMAYSEEVEFSLRADPTITRFRCNVSECERVPILKSACIYGANNSGKTCLIEAVGTMVGVLSGKQGAVRELDDKANMFTGENVCTMGVSFTYDGIEYRYEFRYATKSKEHAGGFMYERMTELSMESDGKENERTLFLKDFESAPHRLIVDGGRDLGACDFSTDNVLIYSVSPKYNSVIDKCRSVLVGFARSVEIVSMDTIMPDRTVAVMREGGEDAERIEALVKGADLEIERFEYVKRSGDADAVGKKSFLRLAGSPDGVAEEDLLRLTSYHRGIPVRSFETDSSGTRKIISLAAYLVDALKGGKTLIVDEMDNGLHFKLTRAIVLLFNDDANESAQLVFATHDAALLDCSRLFREDQVWFVDKDETRTYLYSVADLEDEPAPADFDVLDKYTYGAFGAIPSPDMTKAFYGEDMENE